MKITLGLSLSLSGPYAAMGRQAEAALRLFVADSNAGSVRIGGERAEFALECHDDQSDRARCAEIYRELCSGTAADIILGPYSSKLTATAAPIAEGAGRVFISHGGAADDLYSHGYRMMVGVLSPASEYLAQFVRLLASLKFWRKRLAVIAAPTRFARAVVSGVEAAVQSREAKRGRVRIRVKWNGTFDPQATPERLFPALRRNRVNALASAGSYEYDLAVMRAVIDSRLNIPVLACVAAGVRSFRADLGESAEGIVGASQWEPDVEAIAELGPDAREFAHRMRTQTDIGECDYVAAQAYAAGVLVSAALEKVGSCNQVRLREEFAALRTGTLFGAFEIDPNNGRQVAHRVLTVQWHEGHKVIIEPATDGDRGSLEFPSGWRLIAAGAEMLKLNRGGGKKDEDEDERGDD
ncbi:MAG: ABC transporter substrate-binding protein [Candidatus Binataceae bacterium]